MRDLWWSSSFSQRINTVNTRSDHQDSRQVLRTFKDGGSRIPTESSTVGWDHPIICFTGFNCPLSAILREAGGSQLLYGSIRLLSLGLGQMTNLHATTRPPECPLASFLPRHITLAFRSVGSQMVLMFTWCRLGTLCITSLNLRRFLLT